MTLLDLKTADIAAVKRELELKVSSSPAFFKQSAVVFGFDSLSDDEQNSLDLKALKAMCLDLQLIPAASRGGNRHIQDQSYANGLANLPRVKERPPSARDIPLDEPLPVDAVHAVEEESTSDSSAGETAALTITGHTPTKVVTAPVRSGQQIYAPGGDLIILASVSAGAEVLADGNIHIYGPLRGRALAGIKGDERARIFCGSQEAELVSIAGHYLVDEVLHSTQWKEACQIYIEEGSIKIETLYDN